MILKGNGPSAMRSSNHLDFSMPKQIIIIGAGGLAGLNPLEEFDKQ
jgi:hypothetical protein